MTERISREELRQMTESRSPFVLIDTLPETAFRKGHLPGAINIRSDDILAEAPKRIPDKDAAIVVYCASETCKRAGLSAERLLSLGYTRVLHYVGGKADWVAAGQPLEAG